MRHGPSPVNRKGACHECLSQSRRRGGDWPPTTKRIRDAWEPVATGEIVWAVQKRWIRPALDRTEERPANSRWRGLDDLPATSERATTTERPPAIRYPISGVATGRTRRAAASDEP